MNHLRQIRPLLVTACLFLVSCASQPSQPPSPPTPPEPAPLSRVERDVAVTDNVTIHYSVLGDSGPLIVVPLGRISGDFEPLAREGYRVALMDPRGRGLSTKVTEGISLTTDTDIADIDAVRRDLEEDRITLIGSSYYGALVALYAARHPEHVDQIIMLGPMAPTAEIFADREAGDDPDTPEYRELDQLRRDGVHETDPQRFCRAYYTAHAYQLYADLSRFDANDLDYCELENEWPDNFLGWASALFESIGVWDFTSEAAMIKAPTLVVQGRQDRITPPSGAGAWTASMTNQAHLVWIDDAGHIPYKERPEETVRIILGFLANEGS